MIINQQILTFKQFYQFSALNLLQVTIPEGSSSGIPHIKLYCIRYDKLEHFIIQKMHRYIIRRYN